jgi:hypothetical protein
MALNTLLNIEPFLYALDSTVPASKGEDNKIIWIYQAQCLARGNCPQVLLFSLSL